MSARTMESFLGTKEPGKNVGPIQNKVRQVKMSQASRDAAQGRLTESPRTLHEVEDDLARLQQELAHVDGELGRVKNLYGPEQQRIRHAPGTSTRNTYRKWFDRRAELDGMRANLIKRKEEILRAYSEAKEERRLLGGAPDKSPSGDVRAIIREELARALEPIKNDLRRLVELWEK